MTQREKPLTPSAAAWAALQVAKHGGGYVSGGQIEDFKYGWAMPLMGTATRAHYFQKAASSSAESLCGLTWSLRWLYGRGSFPKCKLCDRRLDKVGVSPL